jgi:hypothetical protein
MSEQIEPGYGWRLLAAGEIIKRGDEFWDDTEPALSQWIDAGTFLEGQRVSGIATYRRRIPAKPEAMEIDDIAGHMKLELREGDETVTACISQENVEDNFSWESIGMESIQSIREVIAWLQQVADWREAQGDSK